MIDPKNNRTTRASFADASIDYIQNGGLSADVLDIRGPTSDEMNVKVAKKIKDNALLECINFVHVLL